MPVGEYECQLVIISLLFSRDCWLFDMEAIRPAAFNTVSGQQLV